MSIRKITPFAPGVLAGRKEQALLPATPAVTTAMAVDTAASSIPAPWLRRVPIPVFAIGMGITGVGLCCDLMCKMVGGTRLLADGILLAGAFAALAAGAAYAAKALMHPDAVRADWKDAAQAPFLGQAAVTLLLLAEAAEVRLPAITMPLFAIGAGLAAVLAGALLARGLRVAGGVPQAVFSPSWAVPGIALLMVPILAPRLGIAELGWGFAGLALAWFAVMGPPLLTHLTIGEPLPERTRPTVAILVAVPSVALLALDSLTEGRWVTEVPGIGAALMAAALLLGAVAAVALPSLLRTVPFGLPWWAYSMPPAALALALLVYGHATGGGMRLLPGTALALLETFGTGLLAWKTTAALMAGRLIPPR